MTANLPFFYSDIQFMLKYGDNNIPLQSGAALIQKHLCECDGFQFPLALYQRGVDQSILMFLKIMLFFWGEERKIRGSRQCDVVHLFKRNTKEHFEKLTHQ